MSPRRRKEMRSLVTSSPRMQRCRFSARMLRRWQASVPSWQCHLLTRSVGCDVALYPPCVRACEDWRTFVKCPGGGQTSGLGGTDRGLHRTQGARSGKAGQGRIVSFKDEVGPPAPQLCWASLRRRGTQGSRKPRGLRRSCSRGATVPVSPRATGQCLHALRRRRP